jgi:hypothetical protein
VTALVAAVVVALAPTQIHFGDLVTATVRGAGEPSFAPFSVREHRGNTYVLQCLSARCVPGSRGRIVTVGAAHVLIQPRATAAQAQTPLRSFRRETAALPTSYRIDPSLLLALLLAAAGLLFAAAAFFAAPLVRRSLLEPRDRRTPLEHALELVRASAGRGSEDRRRALDLLGRALDRKAAARDAYALAWSEPEPEPHQVEAFADSLEPNA